MKKIPVIHITDLYLPPQDPDDHFDLATLFALPEFEIKAVLLDATERFINGKLNEDYPRDPGFISVNQLSYLTGKSFPVAVGPKIPLKSITDDVSDRSLREQSAINLLLEILSASEEKLIITCVGSVRIISAAFNRNAKIMKTKISAVYLNAGSSDSSITDEWNVNLDLNAWKCLFKSGLNIELFPCTGEKGPFSMTVNNTFWKTTHKNLIENLPHELRAWFHYALTGNQRGDFIRILSELGNGGTFHNILFGERNMWSTASIVMAADRILAKTPDGWRFISKDKLKNNISIEKWNMEPIEYKIEELGQLIWQKTEANKTNVRMFTREITEGHAEHMSEALEALFKEIRI